MNCLKSATILFVFLTVQSFAQLNPQSLTILMRDNQLLAADIYLPNGDSLPRPTILIQTPYNKNLYPILGLPLQVGTNLNASPFNFVIVDWRCFYGSTSACVAQPKYGQDGFDCVEWIAQQPWSDGKVATWGPSALGLIQFQTANENPPHLICAVPIVAGMRSDYLKYYPGGVYRTEYVEMLDNLGYGLSTILLPHQVHDIFWTISEAISFYPDSIPVPMFMIGGWYDHATEEVLESFDGIRTLSPLSVRNQHKLLMGPWTHNKTSTAPTQIGELNYPQAEHVSDSLARAFCNFYLLNTVNGWNNRPVVSYFQMGENTWKSDISWNSMPLQNFNLYFHSSGEMTIDMPVVASDSLLIIYDPRNPSPTIGGPTLLTSLSQGPYDQAQLVENRNDLLTFSTMPLSQNVVLRGRPVVHLKVASDMPDTDFSIRLTDVYPDGRSMLVLDGIRRMRFRNGFAPGDTSTIIPGQIYSLDIELFSNTAITFMAGHRIRVDITSSNYPRFDCNLNNGQQMYAPGDTNISVNTVYVNNSNGSYISLPLEDFPNTVAQVNEEAFELYPNPALDHLFIRLNQNSVSGATIKIFDMKGSEIIRKELTKVGLIIPTGDWHPGVYTAIFISQTGLSCRKVLKISK